MGLSLKGKKDLVNLNLKRKFTSAFAVQFFIGWLDLMVDVFPPEA